MAGESLARGSGGGLRVALVYDCLYPQTVGGIEHRNAQLARALAERGHHVTLAGLGEAVAPSPGVEVLTLGPRRGDSASRGARDTLRFAAAMFRLPLARFDVVEAANIPFAHLFPLALRCRVWRRPLLVTWHEVWGPAWRHFTGRLWPAFAALETVAARLGDEVDAVSAFTAARLRAVRAETVPVVPNGVPLAAIRAAARGATPGASLVAAGRLLPHKRFDLLIAALPEVTRAVPAAALTLIGDGPELGRLRALAESLGVADRVRFAGRLADAADVWRALGGARIAVQPSAREGFGIFPLEAMAAGLPVVYCHGADSAVHELVRDGREGLATEPHPEALAAALVRLLLDEGLRSRLAAAAAQRAEGYDWSAVGDAFEALLLGLVHPGERR